MVSACGRTAPSTTGYPHPGTLLSGLLAWLDARSRGARFVLRLEDLDVARTREAYVVALGNVLDWLGLRVDEVRRQSLARPRHEDVLDALARRGLLYACACTRARLRGLGGGAPEIGTAGYDNHCRRHGAALTPTTWRHAPNTVRLRLGDAVGEQGSPDARPLGDPIVRRRDGSVGYALASVVDDAALGVTRVVRGQDLAAHGRLHRAVYRCLGAPAPQFLYHPLLYAQDAASKLSKHHRDAPLDPARASGSPHLLLGALGRAAGLWSQPGPCSPEALLKAFSWQHLPPAATVLRWPCSGAKLGAR